MVVGIVRWAGTNVRSTVDGMADLKVQLTKTLQPYMPMPLHRIANIIESIQIDKLITIQV